MRPRVFARYAVVPVFVAVAWLAPLPAASCPPKAGPVEQTIRLPWPPRFIWPVKGPVIEAYCAHHGSRGIDGINIAVPEGTDVKAAAGGIVQYAGADLKAYGKLVLIRHKEGWITAYAYNSVLAVRQGDVVRQGQVIGHSGRAPASGIEEVHFETRWDTTPVDPTRLLKDQPPVTTEIER